MSAAGRPIRTALATAMGMPLWILFSTSLRLAPRRHLGWWTRRGGAFARAAVPDLGGCRTPWKPRRSSEATTSASAVDDHYDHFDAADVDYCYIQLDCPSVWHGDPCHNFCCRGPILIPRPVLKSPAQTTHDNILDFFVKHKNRFSASFSAYFTKRS